MKKIHIFNKLIRETALPKVLIIFGIFFVICAFVVWANEPSVTNFGDALWYCYAVTTTVGFGDIVVTSPASRILSVILSIFAAGLIALLTGIFVSFAMQLIKDKQKDNFQEYIDKLEHLNDLTSEELEELSLKIKELCDDLEEEEKEIHKK